MMKFEETKTALLIVDLQNDNLAKGGKFESSGAVEHAQEQNVVENIKSIADKARAAGIPVFHNLFVVEEGAKGLGDRAPIFRAIAEAGSIVRGTWGGGSSRWDGTERRRLCH